MAPNIQLAGNFISRSTSATASDAAISAASSSGEAIDRGDRRRRRWRDAGHRQHQRQCCGEDDHAHGLHHRDAGDVGALLGGEDDDLRQRAGTAGQQAPRSGPSHGSAADRCWCRRSSRRWRAPAARWSADRSSCAGSAAATPASPAISRAAPARSASGSAASRAAVRPARRRRPQTSRRKSARPAGPPTETASRRRRRWPASPAWRGDGAVWNGRGHRCGDQGHAALWQIRHKRDKCASRDAAMRASYLACEIRLHPPETGG